MSKCVHKAREWTSQKFLHLSADETKVVVFGQNSGLELGPITTQW